MRVCARVPARPSRELDPISAMSWGVEPVRRDQQGKSTIRVERRLRRNSQNSKLNRATRRNAKNQRRASGSVEPADLFLGHHALDILGLALDAVARASI